MIKWIDIHSMKRLAYNKIIKMQSAESTGALSFAITMAVKSVDF
jgi:hypothetical protein